VIRLAFLGVGWIGRNRLEALLGTGQAEAAAICDPNAEMAEQAREFAPDTALVHSLDQLLACEPDGVVIATPSALHAEQSIAAFESGAAVFCQKPLGRTAAEVEAVLEAARQADRALGVDLSYRYSRAMQAVRSLVESGELGSIFAADLVFHNGYGPQSGWFWDKQLSGGGCLIDLGIHLADLALWVLDCPEVASAQARLFRDGRSCRDGEVEDFAAGSFDLANGTHARLTCSWNLAAGQDAEIRATFYGTEGTAEMRNVNGSFFDFVAERFRGREREKLVEPPDEWGGRAAVDWLGRIGEGFAGTTPGLRQSAQLIDTLYAAAGHR